jgi:hypothetical protein
MRFGLSLCNTSNGAVFFTHSLDTYLPEHQHDSHICLLQMEAGIYDYLIESEGFKCEQNESTAVCGLSHVVPTLKSTS